MKAIIPAAGYATRLYPLTKDKSKPLLPINNQPMLNYVIKKVEDLGEVDHIYIISNAVFYPQYLEWQKQVDSSIPITIINDGTSTVENRLGAIGDKAFAIEKEAIDDDVLDISADNLFTFDLHHMHKKLKSMNNTIIALYDVKSKDEAKKFGVADLVENNKVVGFIEKPAQPKSTLASIGIYMYPRHVVRLFKKYIDQGNCPDMPGKFLEWLHKREDVHGHIYDKDEHHWYDIGDIKKYNEANEVFSSMNKK